VIRRTSQVHFFWVLHSKTLEEAWKYQSSCAVAVLDIQNR